MKVDKCLILGAGMGTRMGLVGESLPKPLFKIFEKTLLELQIARARELGVEKIFVNLFHQKDLIKTFIQEKKLDINIINEPEILGVGGAILNLKRLCGGGSLLVLNCDQFYFWEDSFFKNSLEQLKKSKAVLFGLPVLDHEKYNRLILSNDNFQRVEKYNGSPSSKITYSGVSLVSLDDIDDCKEVRNAKFFGDVINSQSKPVVVKVPKSREYLDFGEIELYRKSLHNLLLEYNRKEEGPKSTHFFNKENVFCRSKVKGSSYNSLSEGVLNFSSEKDWNNSPKGTIIIEGQGRKLDQPALVYHSIVDYF